MNIKNWLFLNRKIKDYTKLSKKEFEKKLFRRFRFLYRDHKLPMSETCMCWGVDTGKGWHNLIWDLSIDIEKELKKQYKFTWWFKKLFGGSGFRVNQVKSKFGTLRYYHDSGNEVINTLVGTAEAHSETICEECGKDTGTSNLKGGAWVYNMCDICWHEHNKDKKRELR